MTVAPERVVSLAIIFEPPRPDTAASLAEAAHRLSGFAPSVSQALEALAVELPLADPAAAQELYTRTFELAPTCAPYLGVHLFGEESFTRAALMTGLADRYRELDFDPGCELPDHIALVLRCAPRFSPDEWQDLVELCLARALAAMRRDLERTESPYRHGVAALEAMLAAGASSEVAHA